MKQVVTISKSGSISSLQRKDGFDVRKMGNVQITRTTDIRWNSDDQSWFIRVLDGPKKNKVLIWDEWKKVGFTELPPNSKMLIGGIITFKEYEDAVKTEIIYLDSLRKQGIF